MTLLRVKTPFAITRAEVWPAGRIVDSSHPVVKGRESLFEPIEAFDAPRTEQATAAPGEVRNVAKRVAKAAKKVAG